MSLFKAAKNLTHQGFYVFPLKENGKTPILKDFTGISSCDEESLDKFWYDPILGLEHYHNIGIATSKFFGGGALLVVDVDNKGDKKGSEEVLKLELEGKFFPKTLTQTTPTGGLHYIYKLKTPVKQGANVLAPGIDIRSRGGYIVGAGSLINNKSYTIDKTPIADAPKWIVDECKKIKAEVRTKDAKVKVNQKAAMKRAKEYLIDHAEKAVQGAAGDQTTFVVAARVKDFGLSVDNCFEVMQDHWNEECQPPWAPDELLNKIKNAYAFGQNTPGADSPEADFGVISKEEIEKIGAKDSKIQVLDDEESVVLELNKDYAFMVLGGKSAILRKLPDKVSYMSVQAFHDLLKSEVVIDTKGKPHQKTNMWFAHPNRATYDSVELRPCKETPPGVFNLWRGFTCEPIGKEETPTKQMIEGVRVFKEHALKNVCDNDESLFNWLMGYFAHLVQKPWEKPLTALVFKGKKGVGKNALIDRIGNLFGSHYMLTSSRRYVTSNFNSHLANLILFVLDEAFWSGDKQAEGILKDLITGNTHLIEQKGRETYSTANVLRICIIGNEDWVAPATEDERRFAVFNIGGGRKKDAEFFTKMRVLIDLKGGNRLLLRELLDFDLNSMDVNDAPNTQGLLEQKIESFDTFTAWWYGCLEEGAILNNPCFDDDSPWPEFIKRTTMREAFAAHSKERGIRTRLINSAVFGKKLKQILNPESHQVRNRVSGYKQETTWEYIMPPLQDARKAFDKFMGQKLQWRALAPEKKNAENNIISMPDMFNSKENNT